MTSSIQIVYAHNHTHNHFYTCRYIKWMVHDNKSNATRKASNKQIKKSLN